MTADPEVIRAFLTARYDEEEQLARYLTDQFADPDEFDGGWSLWGNVGRAIDEAVRIQYRRGGALRCVAAKRRRLARHAPSVWTSGDVRCADHEWEEWPCAEVIDDAQSWADRPDFPEELRLSD